MRCEHCLKLRLEPASLGARIREIKQLAGKVRDLALDDGATLDDATSQERGAFIGLIETLATQVENDFCRCGPEPARDWHRCRKCRAKVYAPETRCKCGGELWGIKVA